MMNLLRFAALVVGLASPSMAVTLDPYYTLLKSSTTGKATEYVSGVVNVAKSSTTPSVPTITLDGTTGGENVSSGTAKYGYKAATFTATAVPGFSGDISGGTGLPESGVNGLTSDLALKAPLASPSFSGTVKLPVTGSSQCLQVDSSGNVSGSGAGCGSGGGGSGEMNTYGQDGSTKTYTTPVLISSTSTAKPALKIASNSPPGTSFILQVSSQNGTTILGVNGNGALVANGALSLASTVGANSGKLFDWGNNCSATGGVFCLSGGVVLRTESSDFADFFGSTTFHATVEIATNTYYSQSHSTITATDLSISTPGGVSPVAEFYGSGFYVPGFGGIGALPDGNNGLVVGGALKVGTLVKLMNSGSNQADLNSNGTFWGKIGNPFNDVWCGGFSATAGATLGTSVLCWTGVKTVGVNTASPTAQFEVASTTAPSKYIVKVSSQDGTTILGVLGDGTLNGNFQPSVTSTAAAATPSFTVSGSTINVGPYAMTDWYSAVASTYVATSTNAVAYAVDMTSGTWEIDVIVYGAATSTCQVIMLINADGQGNYSVSADNGSNGPWTNSFKPYAYLVDDGFSGRYDLSTGSTHGIHVRYECMNNDKGQFSCNGRGTAFDIVNGIDKPVTYSSFSYYKSGTTAFTSIRFEARHDAGIGNGKFRGTITIRRRN